jgi:hypothetical protein
MNQRTRLRAGRATLALQAGRRMARVAQAASCGRSLTCAVALLAAAGSLPGCVAVPIAGLVNLAHKSGTMTITLEGRGDPIAAFREAAIRAGGTVPAVAPDFARAEFSTVDMKVDAQVGTDKRSVTIRGASLSNVGRTYELKDNITEITEAVALAMQSAGWQIKDKKRDRGL